MNTLNETSRSRQKSELGLFFSPEDVFLKKCQALSDYMLQLIVTTMKMSKPTCN
jgi:hypothetical protein